MSHPNPGLFAVFPSGTPDGYFSKANVKFIQDKITKSLRTEFYNNVVVDYGSITRVMQRIIEDRMESIPRMNERVIMDIMAEFRRYQYQGQNHRWWEEYYTQSQQLYDATAGSAKYDLNNIKLNKRADGYPSGSFYFT
jgi:hypothetical protein